MILAGADRYQEALDLVDELVSGFDAVESTMVQLQVDEARELRQALQAELGIEPHED